MAQRKLNSKHRSTKAKPLRPGGSGATAPANHTGRSSIQDIVAGLNALPRSTRTRTRTPKTKKK